MKRLTVALTALVFALTAILINPLTGGAVGVDTAVKLVGGKAVVRAVAEKTGLALSPKQLDNVVDLIEKKTYDGDTEVVEWVNKANLVKSNPSTTPSSKTGFKKYVLDPMLWLTGADLIFEAIDAFQDGYDSGENVDLFTSCFTLPPSGTGISDFYRTKYKGWRYFQSSTKDIYLGYVNTGASVTLNDTTVTATGMTEYSIWEFNKGVTPTGLVGPTSGGYDSVTINNVVAVVGGTGLEGVCSKPVLEEDVVDTTPVSLSTKQSFDNDTYNTNTTYNLEIEMPDVENYNDTTPWNEKDVEIDNEIIVAPPVVIDPDGDSDEVIGAVLVKGDPIETPSNFFTLMADMGAKLQDTYNGVIKFFSDSVSGMEKMLVGSAGLVTFMTGYFDIFPDEFTNVLMVAVMLGFIMHFFRR